MAMPSASITADNLPLTAAFLSTWRRKRGCNFMSMLTGLQASFMVPFFQCCNCFGPRRRPSVSKNTTTSQATRSSATTVSTGSSSSDRLKGSASASASWISSQLFSLTDLQLATNNFDTELGRGGFGVVYKGSLQDGREIAIKKLSAASRQGKQEFLNEVSLLTTVQHRNLIKLYGCCVEDSERILVYEYLSNRSLDKHLFDHVEARKLSWEMRRNIIMGTAKGLRYLHEECPHRMVHRDIKPGNILLDERFVPKIADFGLARLFSEDQTHVSTQATAGTLGYLAPEYAYQGKLSEKADIFSFGVVVLEIISGRKNAKLQQELLLDLAWRLYEEEKLLELLDPRLSRGDQVASGSPEEVVRMGHVALLCTQAEPSLRPAMSKVVLLLSGKSPIKQAPTSPAFVGRLFGSNTHAGRSSSSGGSSKASVVGSLERGSPSLNTGSLAESLPLFSSSTTETFATTDYSEVVPR